MNEGVRRLTTPVFHSGTGGAAPGSSTAVQNAQRRAAAGTGLRHSGHSRVAGRRALPREQGRQGQHDGGVHHGGHQPEGYQGLRKSPQAKRLPPKANLRAETSGRPIKAATSGISRSRLKAATRPAQAPPLATPTAMSTTLPPRIRWRISFSAAPPGPLRGGLQAPSGAPGRPSRADQRSSSGTAARWARAGARRSAPRQ